MKKKIISILLVSVLLISAFPSVFAANYTATTNKNAQDYEYYWASTADSYIYEANGIVRVEHLPSGNILVDTYSYDYVLESSLTIEPELPLWGGFYAGEEYNFLIFGQENAEESAQTESIRIVKYSKNWVRLGQASVYGDNISLPFYAGSLRCAEYGGMLYVNTCRKEYTSADGGNRQSNFTIHVDEETMAVDYTSVSADTPKTGYVTHSFDQYIAVGSRGDVVCLDLGDESPRAIVLTCYVAEAENSSTDEDEAGDEGEADGDAEAGDEGGDSGDSKAGDEGEVSGDTNAGNNAETGDDSNEADSVEEVSAKLTGEIVSVNILSIGGEEGENETGVQLGGLAATSDGFVAVYSLNSDVYMAYIANGFTSTEDISIIRLTEGRKSSGTPVLASKGYDGGWVLWTNDSGEVQYMPYKANGSTGAVVTDRKGTMLSDCQPTAYGDGVIWYVTDSTAPIFFTLDSTGITRHYYAGGWADRDLTEAINAGLVPADIQSDYTKNITRQDFCRIMVSLLELKSGMSVKKLAVSKNITITNPFTDTSNDSVAAAYSFGIVNGVGGTEFAPNNSITRQEAAVMLERTAKLLGLTGGSGLTFSDINECAGWAKTQVINISGYVDPLTNTRVMNGTSSGVFDPLATFTKQQAIVTALRLYHCN